MRVQDRQGRGPELLAAATDELVDAAQMFRARGCLSEKIAGKNRRTFSHEEICL
jgi:hypothetical protein